MVDSATQPASVAKGAHLVLYDGVCGLCSSLLQFLLTHDRRGVFAFASLQSASGRAVVEGLGGDPAELTSFYVSANYRTCNSRIFARSKAALFVASQLGWPWKAAMMRASCRSRYWTALTTSSPEIGIACSAVSSSGLR